MRPASPIDFAHYFSSPRSIHIAIDLAGLAIAGGLFIVPTFAAVQAWAGPDHRARVVAAVNVLNAAFMVVGAVFFGLLQTLGLSVPFLFVLIGVANLDRRRVHRPHPADELAERLLSIVFRAFYRLEVTGLENVAKAGDNAIIAMNHTSFLDAPVAMAILPKRPVFAVDTGIAQRWWIQPFLPFVRTMALDPLKPMALRTIINAVREGNMLVIFPEGRITITGSLMKIYDGAAMIADKSDAMVVPVRIEGPERTIFSRLTDAQVRRRWFPKIKVTILEPVKMNVDPALNGRKRRLAAGAAMYDIMSDMMFRTAHTDRTVVEAVLEAAHEHGGSWQICEDPTSGQLTYKRLLRRSRILGAKLRRWRRRANRRRHAADLERRRRDRAGAAVGGPRSGDDQFQRRRRQRARRLPRRAGRHHPHRARLRRKGPAGKADRRPRRPCPPRLSGRHPQDRDLLR